MKIRREDPLPYSELFDLVLDITPDKLINQALFINRVSRAHDIYPLVSKNANRTRMMLTQEPRQTQKNILSIEY